MARKKVPHPLAPLPSRRALEWAHHKTEARVEILRDVAAKNQQERGNPGEAQKGRATLPKLIELWSECLRVPLK